MKLQDLFEDRNRMFNLPPAVVKAFEKLGDDQRGRPEVAMNKVQEATGGGVLSHVVEHVGDLTHRMSHMVGWSGGGSAGFGYVEDKVTKTLRPLTQDYGFEKEMEGNFVNNAEYRNVDVEILKKNTNAALAEYAAEHR